VPLALEPPEEIVEGALVRPTGDENVCGVNVALVFTNHDGDEECVTQPESSVRPIRPYACKGIYFHIEIR
jgi:hypothetical protein